MLFHLKTSLYKKLIPKYKIMKTNFLLLLFITLTISEVTLAETLNKGTKIELKYHLRKDHRSVIEQPFQVFLNALLLL